MNNSQRESRSESVAVESTSNAVDITVIIPAFNEEQGLRAVLNDLFAVTDEDYEVIVVDDGSVDETAAVARLFPCRLVSHDENQGKGQAMQTGIDAARGEKIIFIDADGTYPVDIIPKISSSLDQYDMVLAPRIHGQTHIPIFNRFGNFLFQSVIRNLYGFQGKDPLTGLYGLHKTSLQKMALSSKGFGIETEIAIKASRMGLTLFDLPIHYQSRIGEAKLNPIRDGYRILKTVLMYLFLYNPSVSFILPGLSLFVIGFILAIFLLFGPLKIGDIEFGPHTMMIATILILLGFQMIVLGISTKLYTVAHMFMPLRMLTKTFIHPKTRRYITLLGILIIVLGVLLGGWLIVSWAQSNFKAFTQTTLASFVLMLIVFGVQILFSNGFLSILVAELLRKKDLMGKSLREK